MCMDQPEGSLKPKEKNKIYKLKTAIYCLKQAAGAWKLILYVDDILITSKNQRDTLNCISKLKKEYDIKDLGETKYYLGIEITKGKDGSLAINQKEKNRRNNQEVRSNKRTANTWKTNYCKNDG
ncbi:hypothetical protein CDAR_542071 [Caerostris darwini]|uniref:Reverse transcriptase Ty1/copia-type domain-containing protein n=1 Tax=Caerostris darwini TaxID=1538125 RepID=A0AAV4UU81_9ARAC|nr:hypothetical protein CDAR_542071 [Caerostris darwini]